MSHEELSKATGNTPRFDWAAIRRDYESGQFTRSELSRLHGPSTSRIDKKADQEGWDNPRRSGKVRSLVKERTQELLAELPYDGALFTSDGDTTNTVEHAARCAVLVVTSHRAAASRARVVAERLLGLLERVTEAETLAEFKRREVAAFGINGDAISSLNRLTQALGRVINTERAAWDLEEDNEARKLTDADLLRQVSGDDGAGDDR